jgi:NADH dehydrogenase (ubiquinone) 1 alpha subcomplex subunit 2
MFFRDFVEQHYVELKKANPTFPILIRECSGVQPKLWARYGESIVSVAR